MAWNEPHGNTSMIAWWYMHDGMGIGLSQRKFILEIILEAGLSGCKPAIILVEHNRKLTTHEYDMISSLSIDDPLLKDSSAYQRLVGKLIYLTMTRPNICYVVQILSQFMHSLKQFHMNVTLKVVKYLKGCLGLGIFLSWECKKKMTSFCDTYYATCQMTRRSIIGFCIKLGDLLISWKMKK
ncbi:uncharacterized mitochondrial protein AtMg00810-like [Rutidosis leptorrhynchoides]|uniref:uncharacterized mitochondrial protein AtMg00810-like n=1 Tax=Rutidosis leptorrhynchoides TaxID=125765 RepID=UPI003A99A4BA